MPRLLKFTGPVGKINFKLTYMPAIKCNSCGRTWGAIYRSQLAVSKKALGIVAKWASPIQFSDFTMLCAKLKEVESNDAWLSARPGAGIGRAQIQKMDNDPKPSIWHSGYGPFFVSSDVAEQLVYEFNNGNIFPDSIAPSLNLFECGLNYLDLTNYGAVSACNTCGRLDYTNLDETAIAAAVDGESIHQFFALPGGVVVSDAAANTLRASVLGSALDLPIWHLPAS